MADVTPAVELRVTVKELQRSWGEVADQALHEPVVITSNGRPRHVLMGVAEYQRLMAASRRAYLVQDMPDPMLAVLEEGLDDLRVPAGTPDGDDTIR